ncbi:hypothetical protein B0H10DRAFT_2239676 [Mycena sp. CBHHK59/15]|nr:hypothetical protein B0H10DRAFT_2239676 [Mycena sp. CBHHK59/15]
MHDQSRKNHDESRVTVARVAQLIAVPQYADILENDEESGDEAEHTSSRLVNSRSAWRKVFASALTDAEKDAMVERFRDNRTRNFALRRDTPRAKCHDVANVVRNMKMLVHGLGTRVGHFSP